MKVLFKVIGAGVIWGLKKVYDSLFSEENDTHVQEGRNESRENFIYSNPRNNHDHSKHQHPSRDAAEAEVRRMQRCGYPGSERLNVYYNREYEAWFTGRSKYD